MVKISMYWQRRIDALTIESNPEKVKENMERIGRLGIK